jgi:hypothetical protein
MNDFSKVYSAKDLKKSKIVTLVTIPMEESIMVPVAQIVDLMKQGENVLFFSFKHDSIKINEFLVPALKGESSPESITGGLSIFDSHQVPDGVDYLQFIEEQVADISGLLKNEGNSLNFIFLDLPKEGLDDDKVVDYLTRMNFTHKVTSVLVSKLNMPVFTAHQLQKPEECEKMMDEFMDQDMFKQMLKESAKIMAGSDLILSVQREKKSFWKKLLNFLLFWRKRNNFTMRVMKNRFGKDGNSVRMNIDMESFKTEVL